MNQHENPPESDDKKSSPSKQGDTLALASLLLTIKDEEHKQTMSERLQRQRIGGIVAKITIALPIAILLAFWIFFIFFSQNADTTLLSVMFSTTHISIVLLYFALIRGMFQADKKDDKTPIEQLSALN